MFLWQMVTHKTALEIELKTETGQKRKLNNYKGRENI